MLSEASNLRRIGHMLLEALRGFAKPTVVVIENMHWADEATLDLLHFVSCRLEHLPVLLILTLRDNEALHSQKLWTLLGSLPPERTERIGLAPLSPQAVQLSPDTEAAFLALLNRLSEQFLEDGDADAFYAAYAVEGQHLLKYTQLALSPELAPSAAAPAPARLPSVEPLLTVLSRHLCIIDSARTRLSGMATARARCLCGPR
jgi:hypothetical protein